MNSQGWFAALAAMPLNENYQFGFWKVLRQVLGVYRFLI
jgi:hypothetical protein